MQQCCALFHELPVRMDESKCTQWQGICGFVESAHWCMDVQTHSFSLALYTIPGHYWDLGSVICFCTLLITCWGERRLRQYTVSELHPHLTGGFLPWEEQSLTHWPGGTRPWVSCNVKSSFGWCQTSFKWLLLHFLLCSAWVLPLMKNDIYRLRLSWATLFLEKHFCQGQKPPQKRRKKPFLYLKTAVSVVCCSAAWWFCFIEVSTNSGRRVCRLQTHTLSTPLSSRALCSSLL